MRRRTLPEAPPTEQRPHPVGGPSKGVRLGATVALVAALAVGCQPSSSDPQPEAVQEAGSSEPFAVLPADVRWIQPPPQAAFLPEGVQIAFLEGGSPLDKGPFTFRLRFPVGSRLMPHTHPTNDRITVISGTLHHGMGRTFDQEATKAFPAGGFVYQPADMPHFVWFDEETVLQFQGSGPFGLTYINPADDPRNQK